MLFTDSVKITAVGIDPVFSNEVDGGAVTVKAYVENNTKVRYGADGAPFTPMFLIFLPGNTSVVSGDTIEILKIHGQVPVGAELGNKTVAQTKRIGGFSVSHIEVMV